MAGKISQGLFLGALLSLVPLVASANYSQPHRAAVNGFDRIYIPGNAPRTPVSISLVVSATNPYSVNQGWARISNTKLDVLEVNGVTPQSGAVPVGAGNSGDLINTGTTGVFYWSGTGNLVETLTVKRSKVLTRTSNACGVVTFSSTATRPIADFSLNGQVVSFAQLPTVTVPSYCRSSTGVLFIPQ